LLDELRALPTAMQESGSILPRSVAGKANNYTLKRWVELTWFLDHPIIELSANWVENSMRPASSAFQWPLHLGSKEAGPKIAAIFSIVESCRKLDIPIRQYLADVLPGLANSSIQKLPALMPTAYADEAHSRRNGAQSLIAELCNPNAKTNVPNRRPSTTVL
jgi:hypothetical protein